jgi:nitric oxide dioxygenase
VDPEQIELVQQSFELVRPHAAELGERFYTRLWEVEPSARSLFPGSAAKHGRDLVTMVGVVVADLHRLERLLPAIRSLGRRHAGYGVQPEHWTLGGGVLLWTLGSFLGEAFTRELEAAWAGAYAALTQTMQAAIDDALAEAAA